MIPGNAAGVAKQFLRCVFHQLAPNGILPQLFQSNIKGNGLCLSAFLLPSIISIPKPIKKNVILVSRWKFFTDPGYISYGLQWTELHSCTEPATRGLFSIRTLNIADCILAEICFPSSSCHTQMLILNYWQWDFVQQLIWMQVQTITPSSYFSLGFALTVSYNHCPVNCLPSLCLPSFWYWGPITFSALLSFLCMGHLIALSCLSGHFSPCIKWQCLSGEPQNSNLVSLLFPACLVLT